MSMFCVRTSNNISDMTRVVWLEALVTIKLSYNDRTSMLADESIRWLIEEAKTSSLAVGQTILLCFGHALKYF